MPRRRHPANHPKVNVLMIYGLLATSATFSTVLRTAGGSGAGSFPVPLR